MGSPKSCFPRASVLANTPCGSPRWESFQIPYGNPSAPVMGIPCDPMWESTSHLLSHLALLDQLQHWLTPHVGARDGSPIWSHVGAHLVQYGSPPPPILEPVSPHVGARNGSPILSPSKWEHISSHVGTHLLPSFLGFARLASVLAPSDVRAHYGSPIWSHVGGFDGSPVSSHVGAHLLPCGLCSMSSQSKSAFSMSACNTEICWAEPLSPIRDYVICWLFKKMVPRWRLIIEWWWLWWLWIIIWCVCGTLFSKHW